MRDWRVYTVVIGLLPAVLGAAPVRADDVTCASAFSSYAELLEAWNVMPDETRRTVVRGLPRTMAQLRQQLAAGDRGARTVASLEAVDRQLIDGPLSLNTKKETAQRLANTVNDLAVSLYGTPHLCRPIQIAGGT